MLLVDGFGASQGKGKHLPVIDTDVNTTRLVIIDFNTCRMADHASSQLQPSSSSAAHISGGTYLYQWRSWFSSTAAYQNHHCDRVLDGFHFDVFAAGLLMMDILRIFSIEKIKLNIDANSRYPFLLQCAGELDRMVMLPSKYPRPPGMDFISIAWFFRYGSQCAG